MHNRDVTLTAGQVVAAGLDSPEPTAAASPACECDSAPAVGYMVWAGVAKFDVYRSITAA